MRSPFLLAAFLLALSGCAFVPPVPLREDPRWQDLMRDGELRKRGVVAAPPVRLKRSPKLRFAEGGPVTIERSGTPSRYCPPLPPGFGAELDKVLAANTGYRIRRQESRTPPAEASYLLELEVTRYRFELIRAGQGSAMAAMWPFGFPHVATFYNAPDELYRCEYRLRATLKPLRKGLPERTRLLRGSAEHLLTDFQRGWTLTSWWPEQKLNWTGGHDVVRAWQEYGPHVEEALEPHARRAVLLDLLRFLREED